MHDDTIGPAAANGHLQRSGDEVGALVRRHGPAHHPAAEDVDDHGQEQEP
jgi:hypothetical protein